MKERKAASDVALSFGGKFIYLAHRLGWVMEVPEIVVGNYPDNFLKWE